MKAVPNTDSSAKGRVLSVKLCAMNWLIDYKRMFTKAQSVRDKITVKHKSHCEGLSMNQ